MGLLLRSAASLLLAAVMPLHAGGRDDLGATILARDAVLFAAFNDCDLEAWKAYLDTDLEFYQDNDDVTTSRVALEPAFRDHCNANGESRLRRELVPGSTEVHPLQGYGAVQFGAHRFWVRNADGREELGSTPRFVHVWRNDGGEWRITRVISYGH